MNELIDFVTVAVVLFAIGIYGLVVKRNAIRMIFSIEIIANAANLNLIAFSRNLHNAQGQMFALFSIAIARCRSSGRAWYHYHRISVIQRDRC